MVIGTSNLKFVVPERLLQSLLCNTFRLHLVQIAPVWETWYQLCNKTKSLAFYIVFTKWDDSNVIIKISMDINTSWGAKWFNFLPMQYSNIDFDTVVETIWIGSNEIMNVSDHHILSFYKSIPLKEYETWTLAGLLMTFVKWYIKHIIRKSTWFIFCVLSCVKELMYFIHIFLGCCAYRE